MYGGASAKKKKIIEAKGRRGFSMFLSKREVGETAKHLTLWDKNNGKRQKEEKEGGGKENPKVIF